MAAIVIDGKAIAQKLKEDIKAKAIKLEERANRKACLAVVLVGNDSASEVYVKNKIAACSECNIKSLEFKLPESTTEGELLTLIEKLNNDSNTDGILVQLPLPKYLSENTIIQAISYKKDVDGLTVVNAGKLSIGQDCLAPCTPSGCIELIKSTGQTIEGKHAVVIGRSNLMGKPIAQMLLSNNATVTICHSRTKNLELFTQSADILIAAIGQKEFIKGHQIKKGAIVIDVGINRHDGKLYGDVEFKSASQVAGYITPVPGGVGPMTIAMLISNTLTAANMSLENINSEGK